MREIKKDEQGAKLAACSRRGHRRGCFMGIKRASSRESGIQIRGRRMDRPIGLRKVRNGPRPTDQTDSDGCRLRRLHSHAFADLRRAIKYASLAARFAIWLKGGARAPLVSVQSTFVERFALMRARVYADASRDYLTRLAESPRDETTKQSP